jgi:hypothetical protein
VLISILTPPVHLGPGTGVLVVLWEHWGHKKTGHIGPANYLLTYLNYLTIVVSAATGATVESTATAVVSTATAVESVVTSVEVEPPQATNEVAITKIAITFFIFVVLYLFLLFTH